VNGANLGFLESAERAVEPIALRGSAGGSAPRLFEGLAQPELQLASGLFREGNGDDPGDFGPAGFDDAHDAADQLGGFAGASGGLDYQCVIERRSNLVAVSLIG
jgi:hypothetical protein